MRITEDNFLSEIQKGNDEALKYLLQTYGWVIKTVSKKHLYKLPWYQEECMNDILLAVWENSHRFDPSAGSFKNWLAGVSRYTCLNYLRKYQRELQTEGLKEIEENEANLPSDIVIQEDIDNDFNQLIKCLTPRDQLLFTQLFKDQYSLDQISKDSGVDKSVLYNRISRGKQKIKSLFKKSRRNING